MSRWIGRRRRRRRRWFWPNAVPGKRTPVVNWLPRVDRGGIAAGEDQLRLSHGKSPDGTVSKNPFLTTSPDQLPSSVLISVRCPCLPTEAVSFPATVMGPTRESFPARLQQQQQQRMTATSAARRRLRISSIFKGHISMGIHFFLSFFLSFLKESVFFFFSSTYV